MKKSQKEFLTEGFGWYGVVAILVAYALLSLNTVSSHSLIYNLLNLTGGIGIVVDAIAKKDRPLVALNVIWVLIALAAIGKALIG